MAKYQGMFSQQIELTGEDGGPVEHTRDVSENEIEAILAELSDEED